MIISIALRDLRVLLSFLFTGVPAKSASLEVTALRAFALEVTAFSALALEVTALSALARSALVLAAGFLEAALFVSCRM